MQNLYQWTVNITMWNHGRMMWPNDIPTLWGTHKKQRSHK